MVRFSKIHWEALASADYASVARISVQTSFDGRAWTAKYEVDSVYRKLLTLTPQNTYMVALRVPAATAEIW